MPIEPLTKTFLDDPNRCQGTTPGGQCEFRAEPGGKYCRLHAPLPAKLGRHNTSLYDLDETEYLKSFSDRINMLGYTPQTRSLRSEVGILRATLERLLNAIEDDAGLHFHSGEIIALSARIESLEKTSLALEKELGQLMSLDEAKQLAGELLEVLFKELDNLKEKETLRSADAKDLIDRLIIPEELKQDLIALTGPLGLKESLENIADAFGDIVSGKDSRGSKK